MTYPKTTFSSYNLPYTNGAREYLIWRQIAPGNLQFIGGANKTPWGSWSAKVTNVSNKTLSIHENSFSELRKHVKQFVET